MEELEQEIPPPSRQTRRRGSKAPKKPITDVPLTDMEKAHRRFIAGMISLAVLALILMLTFHEYLDFPIE